MTITISVNADAGELQKNVAQSLREAAARLDSLESVHENADTEKPRGRMGFRRTETPKSDLGECERETYPFPTVPEEYD